MSNTRLDRGSPPPIETVPPHGEPRSSYRNLEPMNKPRSLFARFFSGFSVALGVLAIFGLALFLFFDVRGW